MGAMVAAQLGVDATKVEFQTSVHPGPAVGGVPTDLVEVTPKYKQDPDAAQAHKVLKWTLGESFVVAVGVVGDRALWAGGRDWRARLEGMLRTARGAPAPSIAGTPAWKRALAQHEGPHVSISWASVPRLADFISRTMTATTTLEGKQRAALEPFLSVGDKGSITATTRTTHAKLVSYELTTTIPAVVLAHVQGIGGAFWRVALGMLAGPPVVPPVPAPPRSLSPPVKASGSSDENKDQDQHHEDGPHNDSSDLPTGRGA
jgi:hypothetical protein